MNRRHETLHAHCWMDTSLTVILPKSLGTTWTNLVKQKADLGTVLRAKCSVRLRMLLNGSVYITGIGHVPAKSISSNQEYHAAQAGHSRREEKAVTALPQACCFGDILVYLLTCLSISAWCCHITRHLSVSVVHSIPQGRHCLKTDGNFLKPWHVSNLCLHYISPSMT